MSEQQLSDHDLLIRLDVRTEKIEKWCTNHTEHHFRYTLMAWATTLGLLVALVLALVKAG